MTRYSVSGSARMTAFMAFTLFVSILLTMPSSAQPTTERKNMDSLTSVAMEQGRRFMGWFVNGMADSLFDVMTPEFREQVGGREQWDVFLQRVNIALSKEERVYDEAVYLMGDQADYYRISRFKGATDTSITTRFVWDRNGIIHGMLYYATPAPHSSNYLDYQTKAALQLPFEGEWFVTWGGREPHQNYHTVANDQRFAYDLLIVRNGSSFSGSGDKNTDYYCFGAPLMAPGAGRVVMATDSVPDNRPGEMDEKNPPGNFIVIDHGNGEYSFMAHLKRGSVAVKTGDAVKAGERIGACGNSGHSSEPHLHYHMQNTPVFNSGEGIPTFFNDYIANGRYVKRGEPTRGQYIIKESAEMRARRLKGASGAK